MELCEVLVCLQGIALTETLDITKGKVIRKLEAGETLQLLEEGDAEISLNLKRIKVRVTKTNEEGWVTREGNKGSKFVEESKKHYIVSRNVALEASFPSGSRAIRDLEVGETFELLEGPKVERKQ